MKGALLRALTATSCFQDCCLGLGLFLLQRDVFSASRSLMTLVALISNTSFYRFCKRVIREFSLPPWHIISRDLIPYKSTYLTYKRLKNKFEVSRFQSQPSAIIMGIGCCHRFVFLPGKRNNSERYSSLTQGNADKNAKITLFWQILKTQLRGVL